MTLDELNKRLKNAKRRALYHSGSPSFGKNRSKTTQSSRLWERYELALCDIDSLGSMIERITGERPRPYDPRADFNRRFIAILSKIK